MEIANLLKLKAWLEAGAPHAQFDMFEGISTEPECGTVCCIAGAAAQMSLTPDGSLPTIQQLNEAFSRTEGNSEAFAWEELQDAALEWLGLTPDNPDGFIQHTLFDPDYAPFGCDPQDAAAAVQRVIDGKEPW